MTLLLMSRHLVGVFFFQVDFFFTCFPLFIFSISFQAREYKSTTIEKILKSTMNSNTQIFNSITSTYIHCLVGIFTKIFNKCTMKLLCNF